MRSKIANANKSAMILQVLDMIVQGIKKPEIIQRIRDEYKYTNRSAQDLYNETIRYIDSVSVANAQEYKTILLERLEQQYRDSYAIEDIAKRIQTQKTIVDSMAKLAGVMSQSVQMINIFEHFPDDDEAGKRRVNAVHSLTRGGSLYNLEQPVRRIENIPKDSE